MGNRGTRGQSAGVGTVLLTGLVIAAAAGIVLIGGPALSQLQSHAHADGAEQSLQQFSSEASLVALGEQQRGSLGVDLDAGAIEVRPDAGEITVYHVDDDGTRTDIIDGEPLGAVVYTHEGVEVAYQGGGVWRTDGTGSAMVSPPEYHYRESTLTFPIIRVTGEETVAGGSVRPVLRDGPRTQLFPSESFDNPVDNGTVFVEIRSDYHVAWYSFFDSRSDGEPDHDPDSRTVTVDLTVPFEETFDLTLGATASCDEDPIEERGTADIDSPTECGLDLPSASDHVDEKIAACEDGDCIEVASGGTLEDEYFEAGEHYVDDSTTFGDDVTFDTTDGDVEVVVDGDLTFSGAGPPGQNHDIVGENETRFFVRGNVSLDDQAETGTNDRDEPMLVVVHSDDTEISAAGQAEFAGNVYAPNSSLDVSGGASIRGAVVVRDADVSGTSEIQFDPGEETTFELEDASNDITYLHVSENELAVAIE